MVTLRWYWLQSQSLTDEYRPIPFLWWEPEIARDLEVLYTDSKGRSMVHTWGRGRGQGCCCVGRELVGSTEGLFHTCHVCFGGSWPRGGNLATVI